MTLQLCFSPLPLGEGLGVRETREINMNQSVADNLEQILTSRAFMQDPYPTYARLRDESPIYWSEAWNCWLITSYDEVAATFKDVEHFSNANRFNGIFEQMPWDIRPELKPLENHFSKIGLLHSDPPDHTRMRKLIHMAFTPKVIRQLRDQVQQHDGLRTEG